MHGFGQLILSSAFYTNHILTLEIKVQQLLQIFRSMEVICGCVQVKNHTDLWVEQHSWSMEAMQVKGPRLPHIWYRLEHDGLYCWAEVFWAGGKGKTSVILTEHTFDLYLVVWKQILLCLGRGPYNSWLWRIFGSLHFLNCSVTEATESFLTFRFLQWCSEYWELQLVLSSQTSYPSLLTLVPMLISTLYIPCFWWPVQSNLISTFPGSQIVKPWLTELVLLAI
jgi:hypothetical protein